MSASKKEEMEKVAFEELIEFIKTNRSFDFSGYKRSSLTRRVNKRMAEVGIESYSEYQDYLQVHPNEFNDLFNTILINVTRFFRDEAAWQFLQNEALPQLFDRKGDHAHIRAWSVGCATGEEAYTLAILLAEALGRDQFKRRAKIYATDVDQEAISVARHAHYTKQELENVPEEYREKYFQPSGGKYMFDKELRRCVIFGVHDVVQSAPISRLDLLVCRNTLMYLNLETQKKVLARFHFALSDYGILFLGMAETMLTRDRFFSPLNQKLRIFKKLPVTDIRNHAAAFGVLAEPATEITVRQQLYEASFQNSPAAQLIIDTEGILLVANSEAMSLFDIKESNIGRPFYELQLSYRPVELRPLIEDAISQTRPQDLTSIEHHLQEGRSQFLDIYVFPLLDRQRKMSGTEIFFTDVTRYRELQEQAESSNAELEHAYEELQSASEELETTNEELQSTVEELETANEELQSSNEEMETMNEELQATNEELQTINDELRDRTEELNQMNAFSESILSSAPMSIVVLDRQLRVLMWSRRSEELWGLRADEVKEQFFLNLDISLPVEKLKALLKAVLEKNEKQEISLQCLDRRGKKITVHITSSPLVGAQKEVAGIILLMRHEERNE
jgi:two-component system CheB/CheR fusion protein